MKTICKFSFFCFAVAVVMSACRKDISEEPDPPVATFDGFKVVDGRIKSPEWLADAVNRLDGTIVSLFRYNGDDYLCLENSISSYLYSSRFFYTLLGEAIVTPEYPMPDLKKELWARYYDASK